MADNCLRKDVNGGKIVPKGRTKQPEPIEAFDEDLPTDITTLVGRCEIGETKFDNDDMSQALKFGEMLWNRLCKMAEHYENMADQYGTGSLRSDMLLQGAKDMRHVLEDTRKDCGL